MVKSFYRPAARYNSAYDRNDPYSFEVKEEKVVTLVGRKEEGFFPRS
jgi:hypothetical protein